MDIYSFEDLLYTGGSVLDCWISGTWWFGTDATSRLSEILDKIVLLSGIQALRLQEKCGEPAVNCRAKGVKKS